MADKDSREGKQYFDSEILDYVARTHAGHDSSLAAAFSAPDSEGMPAIQVAPSEGRFLELLAALVSAKKIVEIGTLAGYSAIRLARGMADGGHLWTIEADPKHAEVAKKQIAKAGLSESVTVLVGSADQVLLTLTDKGPFDLVFVDADKENYANYGRWAREHLRTGGLLVGDNAFLFGNLLEDSSRAEAMRKFHEESASSMRSVCVPTPDGILVAIKG